VGLDVPQVRPFGDGGQAAAVLGQRFVNFFLRATEFEPGQEARLFPGGQMLLLLVDL
jgi:hypothetical protein